MVDQNIFVSEFYEIFHAKQCSNGVKYCTQHGVHWLRDCKFIVMKWLHNPELVIIKYFTRFCLDNSRSIIIFLFWKVKFLYIYIQNDWCCTTRLPHTGLDISHSSLIGFGGCISGWPLVWPFSSYLLRQKQHNSLHTMCFFRSYFAFLYQHSMLISVILISFGHLSQLQIIAYYLLIY